MHTRATNSPTSTSIEVEEGNPISDSSKNPRTECPRRGRRGRSRPGLTPSTTPTPTVSWTAQLPTNPRQTKGLLHRLHHLRRNYPSYPVWRMEREAELLNAIQALQGQVDGLKHDLSRAKLIPKKAALAPVE